MSFWNSASDETKLAQIDGGISLMMTAKQIAMCLGGVPKSTLVTFASKHGRSFNGSMTSAQREHHKQSVAMANRRRSKRPEPLDSDAFAIFGEQEPERLFQRHPHDD